LTQSWKNFFQDKTGQIGKPRFHSRKYLKKSYTGKSTIKTAGKRYLKIPKIRLCQNQQDWSFAKH
ncbi:hypothetical protein EFP56_09690, partial [Lactobacillus helveticus]|nr:hypothetical protein [Lactobacillus helveticus]